MADGLALLNICESSYVSGEKTLSWLMVRYKFHRSQYRELGICVATNKRVYLCTRDFFRDDIQAIEYSSINSVNRKEGLFKSKIIIRAKTTEADLQFVKGLAGDDLYFFEVVKRYVDQAPMEDPSL